MLITNPQDILDYGDFSNVFLYLGSLTDWKGLLQAFTQQERQCPLECLYISCPILQDIPDWYCPEALAFFQKGLAAAAAPHQQTPPRIILYSICDFPISLLLSSSSSWSADSPFGREKMELTIYGNVTFAKTTTTTTPASPPPPPPPPPQQQVERHHHQRGGKVQFYLDDCTDWMGWTKMLQEEDFWREGRWQVFIVGRMYEKQQQQRGLMVDYCRDQQDENAGSQLWKHNQRRSDLWLFLEALRLNLNMESLELKNLTLVPIDFLRRLLGMRRNRILMSTHTTCCYETQSIERIHLHNVTTTVVFDSASQRQENATAAMHSGGGCLLSSYWNEGFHNNNYWLEEWTATWDHAQPEDESSLLLGQEEEFVLQLNRQGKRRFLQQNWEDIPAKDWVNAIEKSRDVSSVYYFLRMNPSICQKALLL